MDIHTLREESPAPPPRPIQFSPLRQTALFQQQPIEYTSDRIRPPPAQWPLPADKPAARRPAMTSQVYGAGTQGSSLYDTADGSTRVVNYVLRSVALATAFVAAVVMGVARETKSILAVNGSPFDFRFKAAGASQFDYFIAVNAIVCFYSAASLATWVMAKGGSKGLAFALTMVDLVTVAFLFSGTGSASAMAVLLRKGSGGLYPRICNVYSKFCGQVSAAIALSMFTALSYLVLAALSYLSLYKRSL